MVADGAGADVDLLEATFFAEADFLAGAAFWSPFAALIAAQRLLCAAAIRLRPAALIFETTRFLAAADFFRSAAGSDAVAFCFAQRLRCAAAILSRAAALSFRFAGSFAAEPAACFEALGVAS